MKRSLAFALLATLTLLSAAAAPPKHAKHTGHQKKQVPPCATSLATCGDEGCSPDNHHDPALNRLKNTTAASGPVHTHKVDWMKEIDDPSDAFQPKGSRKELTDLGEGQQIRIVGYLLVAKPELGGESCNCYFHTAENTDNHLVLITEDTLKKHRGCSKSCGVKS